MNAFELDRSQTEVATAPAEDRQYVIAGAGQGKTEVLVSRILHLAEAEGLNPADEILVLSFSRAAVEAARKRALSADVDQVMIRTFDSLASAIILDLLGPDGGAEGGSFEQRIRQATALVEEHGLPSFLLGLRHLCVDEAQDLVGDRARLATVILENAPEELGFTFLGDPLQGVYDFQLQASAAETTAQQLFDTLVSDYGAKPRALERNYRAQSERARQLIEVGKALRDTDLGDPRAAAGAYEALEAYRAEDATSTSFLDVGAVLRPDPETAAILCATNYEVLLISEALDQQRIEHGVRRRAQDMGAAKWIWQALHELAPTKHPEATVLEGLDSAGRRDPAGDWFLLKQCEANWRDPWSLDLAELARKIARGSLPLPLTASDSLPLTVSTIYRAKGLEYDHVLYIEPDERSDSQPDFASLVRRTYVALSRARESIFSARLERPGGTFAQKHAATGRWTERRFGKPRDYASRMAVESSDVRSTFPYASRSRDALPVQLAILDSSIGTQAQAIRIVDADEANPAFYEFQTLEGRALGISSEKFGRDVRRVFYRGGDFKWPVSFTCLRLSSVESAAGSPEQTDEVGLGRSGLWLVPRFSGLARASWK
ncbi:UvrD-helicase domain-containing protein [Sinomonas gamaensis]|uniref:UvrD-helicase domain-containing protein n=1 Tax=Sinomonas gamaensis TaxID=2565624 RepID=UPI0011099805|nr:UvrD-helicase domain-containing protein [Sinomonas gamaensis]